MSSSSPIAVISGIPIRVHVSLWIMLPLIALMGPYHNLFWDLIFAAAIFVSVALHELGHSLVAQSMGIRVREILLLPIGGVAKLDRMPAKPRDEILMALAGPGVSLALALLFGLLSLGLILQFGQNAFRVPLFTLPINLAFTNLILALFNLIPSFPMDGGRFFRAWMSPRVGKLEATRRAVKIGRILAIAFGVVGLVSLNMFLVAVAFFIYFSAGAEFRAAQYEDAFMRNTYRSPGRPVSHPRHSAGTGYSSPPEAENVEVEYRPTQEEANRARRVFDDLYADWK